MHVLSWNIQSTKNCQGEFDSLRIVEDIYSQLNGIAPEVICLQEVARHMPDYGDNDQKLILEQSFPEHTAIWAPGFSWPAGDVSQEFGNLTLVKKEFLLDSRVHTLPYPVTSELLQMPRTAVEVVAGLNQGTSIRVLNTHLAYHFAAERRQQLDYLSALKDRYEALSTRHPPVGSFGSYKQIPSPAGMLLCGDLNLTPESDDYQFLIDQRKWLDAWSQVNPRQKHPPTCGCFDSEQWPEGEHCRDFGLINTHLAERIISVNVDLKTSASDHQPITFYFDL